LTKYQRVTDRRTDVRTNTTATTMLRSAPLRVWTRDDNIQLVGGKNQCPPLGMLTCCKTIDLRTYSQHKKHAPNRAVLSEKSNFPTTKDTALLPSRQTLFATTHILISQPSVNG